MEASSIRRSESHLAGARGRTLFRRSWLALEPERAIVLLHGYAEHTGRYEHVGAWLAERGSAVHGYDQQGHGRSDGVRGHAASFDALLDDVERCVDVVRAEHRGLPLFVLGHSMGGLLALGYAALRQPRLAGVVSSAAALHLPDAPTALQRLGLRLVRPLLPRLRMQRPISDEALSRDPEVGRAYRADPLVFQHMTVSLAAAIYDGGVKTLAAAARAELPILLLHGGDDRLTPPSGSRAFFDALRGEGASDLRVYPQLRHEIFNEPEWKTVVGDLQEWLSKREPPAAGEG